MNAPIAVGDVIDGKYRVERVLGSGGMGLVVEAVHLELRVRRAIKVMLPATRSSAKSVERFLREARAACELGSEHVARVFDVGRLDDGGPFIVMEHLTGEDLATALLRRGRLPVEEAAVYLLEACEALAEAHARGIVHRDLKPGNLFLTRSNDGSPCVKLLDFGVSKLLVDDDDGPRTSTGTIMGSPHYLSPEQIEPDRVVDARSDVWALGVILHELTTGQCPSSGQGILHIIKEIAYGTPTAPSRVRPGLPAALDAVVLRCLEKDPTRRYADVVALARALATLAPPAAISLVERIARVSARAAETHAMALAAPPSKVSRLPPPPPPSVPRAKLEASTTAPSVSAPSVPRPSGVMFTSTVPLQLPDAPEAEVRGAETAVTNVGVSTTADESAAMRAPRNRRTLFAGVVLVAAFMFGVGATLWPHGELQQATAGSAPLRAAAAADAPVATNHSRTGDAGASGGASAVPVTARSSGFGALPPAPSAREKRPPRPAPGPPSRY